MMKKWALSLFTIFTAIVLVTGCSNNSETPKGDEENTVREEALIRVTISENHGEEVLSEKEVEIEEGAILMDVMKNNFDIEEEGGFITSIDGIEAQEEEQMAWIYSVNDEMATVGAEDYELKNDDNVVFDLQSWE